jgi:exocyst complex component 8
LILLAEEALAKSSRSRPAGHSRVFLVSSTTTVGSRGGGGSTGDGRVQLADNLDLDVYVQSKCQTMNEKVSLPACLLSLFRSCREI